MSLASRRAVRLRTALRRGSSWPCMVDDETGMRWLVKLRGAAQGTGPLVAEVIVAELAEHLGLPVPARALVTLDDTLVSDDHHDELVGLVARSHGVNLGLAWLDGARELVPADVATIDAGLASRIVWLDGLVMNIDRTAANPNLLWWQGRWWLIDHGAALSFQYAWPALHEDAPRRPSLSPVPHLLAARANALAALDDELAARLSRDVLHAAVAAVPDTFLAALVGPGATADRLARARAAYVAFLWKRLRAPRPFVPRRGI